LRELCHLASQAAPGATDQSSGQVDPGLDLGHLSTPPLGLLRTRWAPGLGDPGPVQEQPGSLDAMLGSSSELVPLGEVRRETLQRCSRLVQIVGGGS
jgi:hypothetical protein